MLECSEFLVSLPQMELVMRVTANRHAIQHSLYLSLSLELIAMLLAVVLNAMRQVDGATERL